MPMLVVTRVGLNFSASIKANYRILHERAERRSSPGAKPRPRNVTFHTQAKQESICFALRCNDLLCKVNRGLKIPRRAISAIAVTDGRSIGFFFAAKSENKKLPGALHTPIRDQKSHIVIRMKAKNRSHCWTGLASKKLTQSHCRPSSLPAHTFYQREHYTPNILFVSRPVVRVTAIESSSYA